MVLKMKKLQRVDGGTEFKETELCAISRGETLWYIQESVDKASKAGVCKEARAIKRNLER